MTPPVFLAVDISNLAARAYHAVARGQDGNFFGLSKHRLITMQRTLMKQSEPIRLMGAVEGGKTFRHELYPEYKAHRPEKPEDFRALLDEAPAILAREFGMEVYHSPGFEADDVLAAMADQCLPTGVRLCCVSNDKDLLGLAFAGPDGSGTYVLHSEAGSYHALGPKEVLAKKGVPPHRIALLHALQGDASDGLKGIKGIGPVAAARLAGDFPSMKAIYRNLDRLQKSDRVALENAGEAYANLMEILTTLRFDAPIVRFSH
ncbi:hypothetical protein GCM10022631_26510 [Deinococcus rubellus]|uniref:5'-3' exonuclease n=1 Tax=Deinococcus rubellus TaxID=1889240 RepID=UPI0031E6CA85